MGTFRTILIDPPWPEYGGGKSKRGADRHYPLMSVKQIKKLPIGELANPTSCHLWIWATGNHLASAVDCVQAWGFRLINFRPWVKTNAQFVQLRPGSNDVEVLVQIPQNPGLGQYLRCDAELLMFAVRGKVVRGVWKPRQTIYAPRGRHSAKPECVREDIEHMSPAPRVELFARSRHAGWAAWGNEIECDDLPLFSTAQQRVAQCQIFGGEM